MMPVVFDSEDEFACLQTALMNGKVPVTEETSFWTGGFKHELNDLWAWCTRDSPMPLEETVAKGIVSEQRKDKSDADDFRCLHATFDPNGAIAMGQNLCEAKAVHLACESVEKYVADLLVRTFCISA
jgi:hypothetical protein